MEIERKFVLKVFSGDVRRRAINISQIEQYYFAGYRIRKIGRKFLIGIKKGKGLERYEWESEIPRWAFDSLKKHALCPPIIKRRHRIPHRGYILEIDVYLGTLRPLITMECEFKTKKDAKNFSVPKWLGEFFEVTGNNSFTNRSLAKKGAPTELKKFYKS